MIIYKRIKLTVKSNNAYGYGGFNVSLTQVLVLLMQYGWKTGRLCRTLRMENMEKWHDAGTKMQKSKMYLMISSLRQNI
jgi:prolyl oligopeptidase PreP (S9A serine peptidase family)